MINRDINVDPYETVEGSESVKHDIKPLCEMRLKFLTEKGITFEKFLGGGTYGDVWVARQRCVKWEKEGKVEINRPLAIKILTLKNAKEMGKPTKELVISATEDANLYIDFNHSNIIKRTDIMHAFGEKGGFPEDPKVLSCMEMMDGNLRHLMKSEVAANREVFTHMWSKQILNALKYLHDHKIPHLNIKPENILYITYNEDNQTKYTFKLTDFGLTFKFKAKNGTLSGRPPSTVYTAPEARGFGSYCTKLADVYSVGAIMAELIGAGNWPLQQLINKIGDYDEKLCNDLKINRFCAQLISLMTKRDFDDRINLIKAIDHLWIKQLYSKDNN